MNKEGEERGSKTAKPIKDSMNPKHDNLKNEGLICLQLLRYV